MRIEKYSNKLWLIRHWFKWYRVMNSLKEWEPVGFKKPKNLPSIEDISNNIKKDLKTPKKK